MSEPDEILTTDEVCALIKVKKASLYRWMSSGDSPPYYKLGKHARFKKREVLAWFESKKAEHTR